MRRLPLAFLLALVIGGQAGYLGAARLQMGEKRYFTVAAVEPRGGANVGQEPLPSEPLPAGGGYVMRQPD